ncbi:MAG: hypothetical protein E6Q97_22510 [Desulfurellales bacterium]|nr:MAG: hypothetical protein E6Q97_22510 [Desulfurellales bacterium]
MTVPAQDTRVTYTASGSSDTFAYPFRILSSADLLVYVDDDLQVLTTDYTVTGVDEEDGGNVVFTADPAADSQVIIMRNMDYGRTDFDYQNSGSFRADTVNRDFDALALQIQQLAEKISRAPLLSVASVLAGLAFPSPGAGQYIRWNAAGTALEAVSTTVSAGTFLQSGTGAVEREANAKMGDTIHVRDYGAVCNGVADDTAAIQAALDAAAEYSTIELSGVSVISATITIPRDNLTIKGNAKLIAKAGTSFEYMMLATSRSKIKYEKLEFDANQTNRVSVQAHRFMGAGFLSCTDSEMMFCKARNTLGYSGIPAVGLVAAGSSIRCKIIGATVEDSGGTSGTNAGDGIFTSGWNNLIQACTAANCTDTAFVIESSNFSEIVGCNSYNCAAGGAITNASADACYGNQINGLSVFNWDASNTGGIQIGVPTATAGDLINTVLTGVAMYAETSLSKGDGAAINIRNAGSGIARGVTINAPAIRGSRNQGILVNGEEVTISAPRIRGTTDACIQFQSGTDHSVTGGTLRGGSFGVYSAGTSEVQAVGVTCKSTVGTGIYAAGTSTIDAAMCIIKSPSVARYGKAGGATLNVVTMEGNNLSVANQRAGTAGSGAVAGSFLVYDNTGNTLGYVDYKPT